MKKTKIIYWIFTGLFIFGMVFSAITELMMTPEGLVFMKKLGYPVYIVPFLGVTKILGVIALLVPGFPRVKEWAYAGFCIDLVGATYSQVAVGAPAVAWLFMIIWFVPFIFSYVYYHKRLAEGSTR